MTAKAYLGCNKVPGCFFLTENGSNDPGVGWVLPCNMNCNKKHIWGCERNLGHGLGHRVTQSWTWQVQLWQNLDSGVSFEAWRWHDDMMACCGCCVQALFLGCCSQDLQNQQSIYPHSTALDRQGCSRVVMCSLNWHYHPDIGCRPVLPKASVKHLTIRHKNKWVFPYQSCSFGLKHSVTKWLCNQIHMQETLLNTVNRLIKMKALTLTLTKTNQAQKENKAG